jgi:hypothetical protein
MNTKSHLDLGFGKGVEIRLLLILRKGLSKSENRSDLRVEFNAKYEVLIPGLTAYIKDC